MRKLAVAVIALVSAAVAALAVVFVVTTRSDVSELRHQVARLQSANTALASREASDYQDVSGKISGLTVPTDPLSAYNQICTSNNTNSVTGVDQTYYYPCTNMAQTIPQPGN